MTDEAGVNGPADKPAILQDQEFVVKEGILYKALRTGAIWMNKLFFGAISLLVIWLLLGLTGQIDPGCAPSVDVDAEAAGAPAETEHCSVWLSATAKYLGAMTAIAFALSIAFGLLGLVVGKNILPATKVADELPSKGSDDEDR